MDLFGVGGWKMIGNSSEGKGKVMCLDPKAQRCLALHHTLTAFPVDFSQCGSGFGAVCSCPKPQWVIQSRWDEGPTLNPTSKTDLCFPAWDFSVKQEQQCLDQVGEGYVSSQHTAWFFPRLWEEAGPSEPKS